MEEFGMKDKDCIFCKIANGEIPSATIYEDEDFRVILDLGPASRGHALTFQRNILRTSANWTRRWRPGSFRWQLKSGRQ